MKLPKPVYSERRLIEHGNEFQRLFQSHGWIQIEKGRILRYIVAVKGIKTCYEAGTRFGWSACWMALGGATQIHTWDVQYRPFGVDTYTTLGGCLVRYEGSFNPNAMSVLVRRADAPILIHIDGDHSLKGIRGDFQLCLPWFRKGDVICIDNTNSWPAVQSYVEEAIIADPAFKTTQMVEKDFTIVERA